MTGKYSTCAPNAPPPKFPAGVWIDGDYANVHFITTARDDATAIRRAAQRCQRLREMTGLYWKIDHEMKRDGKDVHIGGDLLLNDLELV
jgi:hypothetical protein